MKEQSFKARAKRLSAIFVFMVALAGFGVVSGSVVRSAVAPEPVMAFCENDACIFHDGWFDDDYTCEPNYDGWGCDMLDQESCGNYPCLTEE